MGCGCGNKSDKPILGGVLLSDISLVYIGQFDRAPFFGGLFWFDRGVPLSIRGDLAAQLLFTVTTAGDRQFQVETQADFDSMLANGYIAPGTVSEGLVWTPPQAVVPDVTVASVFGVVGESAPATDAEITTASTEPVDVDGSMPDAPATDADVPKTTGRRRGASA
jgi:hypothetical protein